MARRISQAELVRIRAAWQMLEGIRAAVEMEIASGATIEPGKYVVDLDAREFVTTVRRRRPGIRPLPSRHINPHGRLLWTQLKRPYMGLKMHRATVVFYWSLWFELKQEIAISAERHRSAAANCAANADIQRQIAATWQVNYYLGRLVLAGSLYTIGLRSAARVVAFPSLRRVIAFDRNRAACFPC